MDRLIPLEKVNGLVDGCVFGPVQSRRFGRSLGINPLPPDRKLCTFDCLYCECGPTSRSASRQLERQSFPPTAAVLEALRHAVIDLLDRGSAIDSLTLTGNGETTLHPDFEQIVAGLRALRDEMLPGAQIVVLTNGTRLSVPSVGRALARVDQCVVKIDAGRESTFRRLNRPVEPVTLDQVTAAAAGLPGVIAQTMFARGQVDNTEEDEVEAWIERLRRIRPRQVQVYSLDRAPARSGVVAVPPSDLEAIAARLAARLGLPVKVYG